MKDRREEWFDAEKKVAVTIVDVTAATEALASGHLAGPAATYYLARGLAAVALLGAETGSEDEVVSLQVKCSGPLGGLNVECTHAGTLRGYTEKKVLDDFDILTSFKDREILGDTQVQVTRSVPGRILSQGLSSTLDCYLAGSLQRKASIQLEGTRGVLIEELPDGKDTGVLGVRLKSLQVSSRKLLSELKLARAELRKTTPLRFACRCSPDRARAMLAALSADERRSLPPRIDITCHMCGRTFTIPTL